MIIFYKESKSKKKENERKKIFFFFWGGGGGWGEGGQRELELVNCFYSEFNSKKNKKKINN